MKYIIISLFFVLPLIAQSKDPCSGFNPIDIAKSWQDDGILVITMGMLKYDEDPCNCYSYNQEYDYWLCTLVYCSEHSYEIFYPIGRTYSDGKEQ